MHSAIARDYAALRHSLAHAIPSHADATARMQALVDAAWTALHPTGVSWIGFYLDQPGQPDDRRMVLGPCRDKPACSPIGLHGACGRVLLSGEPLIVRDVRDLGPNYIACDPRDQSELVIPLWSPDAGPWAVLDVDSWNLAAFDDADRAGFTQCLHAIGFSTSRTAP